MTRDEAIANADECWRKGMTSGEHCVAMFEALGLLKLDKPKDAPFNDATSLAIRAANALYAAGLKIVEK